MFPRLLAALFVLCASLLASPITIGGLSYISADPGQVASGFLVTDPSGVPMPYRCDTAAGFTNCSASLPQTVQWMLDTSDPSAGIVRITTPGRIG